MSCRICRCVVCSCTDNEQVKIAVNKVVQNPDEKDIINIKVPTRTSDLINDSGFGQGGQGDLNKIDAIRQNGSLVEVINKVAQIITATRTSQLTNDSNFTSKEYVDNELRMYLTVAGAGLYTDILTPSSEVPTDVGDKVFLVTIPGTYTNFGNVVLPENNFGFIFKNGNSFSLQSVEMPTQDLTPINNKIAKLEDDFVFSNPPLKFTLSGFYSKDTGILYASLGYYSTPKYNTAEGFKFINPYQGRGNAAQVVFFKKDGTFLSSMQNVVDGVITTPADAYQVAFSTETQNSVVKTMSGFLAVQSQTRQNNDLTALMDSKDAIIFNQLLFKIESLESDNEIQNEKDAAMFIEQSTMVASSECPTNPTTLIIPNSVVDNVVNADFSSWGSTKIIMIAVEYSDGTHGNHLVSSFTSTQCTLVDVPTKNIVKLQSMHDQQLGQHLTELGYKALAERLWNYSKRTAYRNQLVKSVAFENHEKDATLINGYYGIKNKTTGLRELEFKLLNSYPISWVGINPLSQIYYVQNSPTLGMHQSNVVGAGISIPYNSTLKGFAELYLGTNLSFEGSGILEVKKSGVTVFSKIFKGSVKRIIVPLEVGNYEFEIKVNENALVRVNLSSISFWKKREVSESIWSKNDKVLFITDSWGEYPVTTIESEKGVQYNGVKARAGKCTMPSRFRELFVANGGIADNVQFCTRGGFTSAWAKYWLQKLIDEVKPTKIVFHFGINDRNSYVNLPSTSSAYDFDKDNIFLQKLSTNGGGFGSVSKSDYAQNLLEMKQICLKNSVKPIFFMMPITSSTSQSAELMMWNIDVFLKGF